MTINSAAGWSLIIAVVLGLVGSLFTPGGMLMEPVDPANFVEAAGALGDNAAVSQYVTFLFVISVVLYWFGLHTLNRAFSGGSLMDRVSSFALNIFLIGYAFLIVELSVRHILIHVLEHGVGGSALQNRLWRRRFLRRPEEFTLLSCTLHPSAQPYSDAAWRAGARA